MDYSELVILVKKHTKDYMNATLKQDWTKAKDCAVKLIESSVQLGMSTPNR